MISLFDSSVSLANKCGTLEMPNSRKIDISTRLWCSYRSPLERQRCMQEWQRFWTRNRLLSVSTQFWTSNSHMLYVPHLVQNARLLLSFFTPDHAQKVVICLSYLQSWPHNGWTDFPLQKGEIPFSGQASLCFMWNLWKAQIKQSPSWSLSRFEAVRAVTEQAKRSLEGVLTDLQNSR